MNKSDDEPTEYQGYYIMRDMIEPKPWDHSNATAAENTRFAIMKMIGGQMKTINHAMTEEAARNKIDELVAAESKRDEQSLRRGPQR